MKLKYYLIMFIVLVTAGCKKGGSSGPDTKPTQEIEIALISPAQNEVCTTGEILSDSQSKITFTWQPVSGAGKYTIAIGDLLTNTAVFDSTSATTYTRTLKRNTPYSWTVISKVAGNSAQSKTWRFYSAGAVTTGYAPFPAVAIAPTQAQNLFYTTTVSLSWNAKSVDNNIKNYDVYFGTTTSPPIYVKETTATSTPSIAVDKKTYYWKVVTRDTNGNTSESQLFQFTVQ